MELLRGEEIGKLLKRVGALPKEDVVRYLYETSLALDKTHRARIVHRDLKPDNLFLCDRERGPSRIKVLDFGIAKIVSDASTQANATRSLGTPLYMAPEQFLMKSAVSGATDIYALGMIAFTLLVGKPYWYQESKTAGEVLAFAIHVAHGPHESAVARAWEQFGVELPKAFDLWFFRATARDPGARFSTASEAVIALAEALHVASPEEEAAPTREVRAAPKVVVEAEVEPATMLLPTISKSSPTGPVPTAPTQLGMTSATKDEAPPAKARRSRSLMAIGFAGVLVVGLGGWFVVKGFAGGNVGERQAPAVQPVASAASAVVPQAETNPAVVASSLPAVDEVASAAPAPTVPSEPSAEAPKVSASAVPMVPSEPRLVTTKTAKKKATTSNGWARD
jgi:serine/threonine-protein kinase